MKIIGIAGGSGTGKSTVSYSLVDEAPDLFEVINIDDYQKYREDSDLPHLAGMINWDHPDIIRWEELISDIKKLQSGEEISIEVWAHRSNPDYFKHYKRIPRIIQPRPILIVEGYLALFNPRLNTLYDRKFYFDLDKQSRHWQRDKKAVLAQDEYLTKVLEPMHQKYVEPTKQNADTIIDVSTKSIDEICSLIKDSVQVR
jgi:uridine kinase